MIDTNVQSTAGEYARMLVVLNAACSMAWSACRLTTDSAAIWVGLLSITVLFRGMGPIGTGIWRSLSTNGALVALLYSAIPLRTTVDGVAVVTMLVLLSLKVTTEFLDG